MKKALLILIIVLLSGCIDQRILDEVRLTTAVGYDPGENDQIKVTAVSPFFQADKSTINETFTVLTPLSKDAKHKFSMSNSKPFVSGKIEAIIINEELADNGVLTIVDGMIRDPSIGSRAYIATTKDEVSKLLQGQYSSQDNGMFISDTLDHNIISGSLPRTNLHLFFNDYYAKGKDPFIPDLSQDKNSIKISGVALLKEDQIVGHVNQDQLFTFKTLVQKKTENDTFLVDINDEDQALLFKISSHTDYDIQNLNNNPEVKVKVKMNLTIREYSESELNEKKIIEIETAAEEKFKEQATNLIQQFQELNVDPIGIGQMASAKSRQWNKEQWYDQYPDINFQIETNFKITETGVAE
ncbi:Ger(x)C family spore germination protein [Aquisalibacillus elongatus]|uniref:Spore germination protein n=1 Tax=Aquisalibacillus elongatus TaxID=485577 RepID=A0A3N5B3B4_9BACI|nr:Ger(x)C family spore germination protein [Aquisalibacillus elongatus]RPF52146.1 spore germination protein [Aquisalibacillus elongatus]